MQAVDLTHNEQAMTLTFRGNAGGPGGKSILHLEAQPMRQWMSILYQQWQAAGWRMDVWPAWIGEASTVQGQSTQVLH